MNKRICIHTEKTTLCNWCGLDIRLETAEARIYELKGAILLHAAVKSKAAEIGGYAVDHADAKLAGVLDE